MGNVVSNYLTGSYKELVSFFVKDRKISKEELKDLIDLIENDQEQQTRSLMINTQTINSIFLYLLQVNVIITILFIFYKLFFDKDTFFGCRRFTLMGMTIAALVLPLIPDISFTTQMAQPIDEFIATFTLPELSTASEAEVATFPWIIIGELAYLFIASILLLRTLIVLTKLSFTLVCAQRVTIHNVRVCLLSKDAPPFSFFKWICMLSEGLTDEQ